MRSLVCVFLLCAMICANSDAQIVNIPSSTFNAGSGMILNGTSAIVGGDLRVSDATLVSRGASYFNTPLEVANGFDTTFDFRVTNVSAIGGSGFTFIIHNDGVGTAALGGQAHALGYGAVAGVSAISNSLAIEFDFFLDALRNDPSNSHVSIHTNGAGANSQDELFSIGSFNTPTDFSDGSVHSVRVRYIPGTLDIFLDGGLTPVISALYDFNTGGTFLGGGAVGGLTLMPGGLAHVGFTGSTPGSTDQQQDHDVLSWTWVSPTGSGDFGAVAISAPVIDETSCVHTLTASEFVTVDFENNGASFVPAGTVITFDYFFDTVNVLTDVLVTAGPILSGATTSFTTAFGIDMSAIGAHTLEVDVIAGPDANPFNNRATLNYTSPGATPVALGYSENFDSLPSNMGAFAMTVTDVPTGWINVQDDGASLAGNTYPDWGPNDGPTGSTNAGPLGDATSGLGIYMYIEDSGSQVGDIELRSPCLDTSGSAPGAVPTLQFAHFSRAVNGAATDNILDVDVINESTGSTVTMSVLTLGGYGDTIWHINQVDLSAFFPDVVRAQFRTNNNNGNFIDDIGLDDVLFFDLTPPTGQPSQPGNAVFDINSSSNSLGQSPSSGGNGPYQAFFGPGDAVTFSWEGQANSGLICMFGPQFENIASFGAPVGQLDIGSLPLVGGVPGSLFIFGDFNLAAFSLFDAQFFCGAVGDGFIAFQLSPIFVPGFLTRFQCVMNPAGQFFLSNAVDVTIN
ncbi:MAG: hypothetical protein ACI97A_003328 [Planctomycetota bacterium]|jgi:hypothetical protein